jgi:hypothetical protein
MVNIISWASYAYALGILLLFYYVLIGFIFYRNEVKNLFLRSQPLPLLQKKPEEVKQHQSEKSLNKDSYKPGLKVILQEAAERKFPREELLLAIRLFLRHNAVQLDDGPEKINEFIIEGCKKYCSIHLSVEEVNGVWVQ